MFFFTRQLERESFPGIGFSKNVVLPTLRLIILLHHRIIHTILDLIMDEETLIQLYTFPLLRLFQQNLLQQVSVALLLCLLVLVQGNQLLTFGIRIRTLSLSFRRMGISVGLKKDQRLLKHYCNAVTFGVLFMDVQYYT